MELERLVRHNLDTNLYTLFLIRVFDFINQEASETCTVKLVKLNLLFRLTEPVHNIKSYTWNSPFDHARASIEPA